MAVVLAALDNPAFMCPSKAADPRGRFCILSYNSGKGVKVEL